MVISSIGGLLGFVALYFIANYMPKESFGIVAFALSFTTMFGIVKKLGFESAHIKRVSEGQDLGECIGTFIILKIILTVVYIAVVLGSIYIWTVVMGRGFESNENLIAIYIMVIYAIITSFTEIMKQTFMARKEIAIHQVSIFLGTVMRVVATIIVALSGKGTIELAFTYIIAETATLIVAGIFFSRFPIKRPTKDMFKKYSKFALPVVIISSITLIIANIDKVFIQLFWGAEEVADYFAVYKIVTFLIVIEASVGQLLFPTYSELHAKKDKEQIKRLVVKSERYLSMTSIPIVFFMIALPYPIINILLDPKYETAVPVLQILPIWALLNIITRSYGPLLLGMDRPWLATLSSVVMVGMNVGLNLILIPIDIKFLGISGFGLGAAGAAIATVCTAVFGFIYARAMAWYLLKLKWKPTFMIKHVMAASVMVIALLYLSSIFEIVRWYQLVVIFLIAMGIYFGILFAIREFKKEDYNFFLDTLNPKKMISYISDEVKGKK
jgi:O-antigen/teichoic acid export membrane protein